MREDLLVLLGDTVAGTLTWLPEGRARFAYAPAYQTRPGATPLSLCLPLRVREHPASVVTAWLWGLLPENDAVLTRWARHFQVSPSSPFALLSTPIGLDCAGAVRFVHQDALDALVARSGSVAWLTEAQVASRLGDLRTDAAAWLGRGFTGRFSLAGAQAKLALLWHEGRWGEPDGRVATSHILKPAVAGLADHDLNEHLCCDAARRAGLVVARTRIARFGEETAIIIERYDRRRSADGTLVRAHQEDLCQAFGLPPARKYQADGGPGPQAIARLLRQAMPTRVGEEAVWRFVEALAWNWLIGGTDAHAKNYSLLLAGAQVRLAPLYDLASALPYGAHEKTLRLAMKLGGDYRVFVQRDPWPAAAKDLGVDPEQTAARVAALAARVPDAFADAAADHAVASLGRPLPGRLVDLVAARTRRCLDLVRVVGPER